MDVVRQAVAFLFRRAGESEMTEEAIVRQASLDLHWFSPRDARRFVEAARSAGHLEPATAHGRLRPTFSVDGADVSLDFRIDAKALDAASRPAPVADELALRAAEARGVPLEEIVRAIAARSEATLIEAPAAAALVAAEAGVDLQPYFARIRAELAAQAAGSSPSSS